MSELARLLDAQTGVLITHWAARVRASSAADSLQLERIVVVRERLAQLAKALREPQRALSSRQAGVEPILRDAVLREVIFEAAEASGITLSMPELRVVTMAIGEAPSAGAPERVPGALEAANVGLWQLDVVDGSLTADARANELIGVPADAPSSLVTWLESLPFARDREQVNHAISSALAGESEGTCQIEFRARTQARAPVRWLEIRGRAAHSEDGRITRLAGLVMDISARKQAEEQIRAKTAWLSLLLDNTKDYAVILSDVRRVIVEWQGGASAITGYSAAEVVGQSADILFTESDRVAALPEKETAAAIRDGRAEDKRWHLRKDGSQFFADGVMTALYDGEGNLNGFGKVFRDATAQKRAEDALRLSDERLHFALRAGRMGTWDLDLASNEFTASETCKANFGRAPNDPFRYEDWIASVLEDERASLQRKVEAAIDGCTDLDVEFRVRWPDSSVHWVHVRASCTQEGGQATALSGVSTSIDERKAIEEELRAADRRKDEFLSTASHELRTPLNAILGWASMLRSGRLDADASRQAAETIERNARAQVKLIEDILDGSRIITGKLRLEVRPLDMTELVGAAIDAIQPAADAKHITLSVWVDPAAARVVGDPDRLQQVVWNLGTNAIKFTPRGGAVEIRLHRTGTSIELRVKDTGQGIAPDFLPHVFERFRQADGTTTRRHGGLGLGLALVRHLVDAHGGTVRAESEGEGRGSTFIVHLPVHAVYSEPPPSSRPSSAGHENANLAGVTALVVDDEADARDLVAAVLRLSGARVRTAGNAEDALAQLSEERPMVVLSDIGMPLMDGYAFIKQVRQSVESDPARLPAIALTAYAREEDRRLALAAGFQVHVAKPVDPTELVRAVSGLVAGTQRPDSARLTQHS